MERAFHDETGADLGCGVGGNIVAAKAETAKSAERLVFAELLLEVEAKPRLRRAAGLREKWLDAIDPGPKPRTSSGM